MDDIFLKKSLAENVFFKRFADDLIIIAKNGIIFTI